MARPKVGTTKARSVEVKPRRRKINGQPLRPEDNSSDLLAPSLVKRMFDSAISFYGDRRLGSVLGRMHTRFGGVLSDAELEAGFRYAEIVGAYEKAKGHPRRASQSASFEWGRKGVTDIDMDALRRMDPEVADKIERRVVRAHRAIQTQYDRAQTQIPHFPILIPTLVEQVCCNDEPIPVGHHPMVKRILRNLAERVYPEIIKPGDPLNAAKKAAHRRTDALTLARWTVDEIVDWFSRRSALVTGYRIARIAQGQQPAITTYGFTRMGRAVERTIRLRRSGLLAEAINAQLVNEASARGWPDQPVGTAAGRGKLGGSQGRAHGNAQGRAA